MTDPIQLTDSNQPTDARKMGRRRPQSMIARIVRFRRLAYGVLLTFMVACGMMNSRSRQPEAQQAPGKIVARVNGEAIYESALTRDLPTDSFEDTAAEMRKSRLDHLITQIQLRQFLDAHRVPFTAQEVDKAITLLKKTPPTMGCPCCRYPSLDVFLKDNDLTMSVFRVDLGNDLRLTKYVKELFDKTYATKQSRAKLIAAQRKRTESEFAHVWQIFFNTFQQVNQHESPAKVSARKRAKAEAAWLRLQKGESFAQVAKQTSEDQTSRDKGGDLGFISKEAFGKEFDQTLARLKPGETSRPFASPYGYHIIKWAPIKDEELLPISQVDFIADKNETLLEQIASSAKVEKY